MRTFQEVQDDVRAMAEDPARFARYLELRQAASADLERELREWLGEDHGEGIGSSDVSCHMIEMIRTGDLHLEA